MTIERLGDTRRNVMIPRYWRYVEQVYTAGAVSAPIAGAQVIICTTFTPTDPCSIKLHYNCWLNSQPTYTVAWAYTGFTLQVSVGGGAWANIFGTTYESFYDSNVADNWTVAFGFIDQNRAANVSLQYRIWAQSSVAAQVLQQVFDLDICRE